MTTIHLETPTIAHPQPSQTHAIIPIANLQSVVDKNLALCSLYKKEKRCLVTCNSSYFASILRVECNDYDKEKRMIRENIRQLEVKQESSCDKLNIGRKIQQYT